jgi:tetratricopeptide (TPR) repeat protein
MTSEDIDEACRRRFEQARRNDSSALIDDYLPPTDSANFAATLEELVLIDLEFAWKSREGASAEKKAAGPKVEDYLLRFPRLNERDVVLRLLRSEYELRSAGGATPPLEEYRLRFPHWILSGREVVDASPTLLAAGRTAPPEARTGDIGGHVLLTAAELGAGSNRYSLTRLHAEGGLGRVWVAHDGSLDRDVALKELKPHTAQDPDAWRRFFREAQVTGQLEHPNIVPVYELNRSPDKQPFYTMRLVKGKTLREAIQEHHDRRRAKRDDPLEMPRLLQAFNNVCQAVSYAHSRGVIHRDLKPENVILGDFGEVLLLDWGLAKTRLATTVEVDAARDVPIDAGLTAHGSVIGTPAYMAPEQAAGESAAVDERTDVFGLGAMLFEVLAGRPPRSGNVRTILADAIHRPAPRVRQFEPAAPAALDAVCAKALSLRPADRYSSAVDLARDVQRFLADEPTTVYREPIIRRMARWARKHRTTVAVLGATALFMAVATIAGLFGWQHLENRRKLDAERYVAEVRSRAAVDEALAVGELRQGHFGVALELLERADADMASIAELHDDRDELAGRLKRTRSIETFYRRTDEGEQLEFFEQDERAAVAVEAGLRALGVFDAEQWWTRLPDQDLTSEQSRQLREDVFRELLLLAAIRAKRGLAEFGAADSAETYRDVLSIIARAEAFSPSQSARVLEVFAKIGLSPLNAAFLLNKPAIEPDSQADLYFVGLMQYWFGQSDDVTRLLKLLSPLTKMTFDNAAADSERMLRAAVARNPKHFWTWFFLGWTKFRSGDLATAELIYDTCIALRPDSAIAYVHRGLASGRRSKQEPDDGHRNEAVRNALADGKQAEALDPLNPDIIFLHFELLKELGRNQEAQQASLRSLDLEPSLAAFAGRRVRVDKELVLNECRQFSQETLQMAPNDVAAWQILAETMLRLGDAAAARRAAEETLRLRPGDARALIVRGSCFLSEHRAVDALRDFDKAAATAPADWRARYGRAQALAAAEQWERALSEFDEAERIARVDWQRAASLVGRAQVCARLNRGADVDVAWIAARQLDPTIVDPRIKPASTGTSK